MFQRAFIYDVMTSASVLCIEDKGVSTYQGLKDVVRHVAYIYQKVKKNELVKKISELGFMRCE